MAAASPTLAALPMKPCRRVAVVLVVVLAAGACRPREVPPVARLSTAPAAVELPYPGTARLEARWELAAPLPPGSGPLQVFVHLRSGEGEVLRTFDQPLPFEWEAGERRGTSIELWQSAMDPALPAGTYDLTAGLYDPQSGRRFPLETSGEAVDGEEYRLARVEVPAASSPVRARFAGGFLPAEASADRQVLNRRWATDGGEIVLEGLAGPTDLTLAFQLPALPVAHSRLVLDEGESAPGIRVGADCSEERVEVSGFGLHRLRLRLRPTGGLCTVSLDPTFVHIDLQTLARRSVLLEVLAWGPAGD